MRGWEKPLELKRGDAAIARKWGCGAALSVMMKAARSIAHLQPCAC